MKKQKKKKITCRPGSPWSMGIEGYKVKDTIIKEMPKR